MAAEGTTSAVESSDEGEKETASFIRRKNAKMADGDKRTTSKDKDTP